MPQALPVLMQNEAKDRDDIFVNVIERITREYPMLLSERRLFLKLLAFVNILTGSMRGAIFKSLDRYVQQCEAQDLVEVSKSLQAVFDDILADISDDNQQNFLILLTSLTKISKPQAEPVLEQVVPRLKLLFAGNKNEFSRALFYDLMVYLYDNFPQFQGFAKSSLIRGLADPSKEIREKLSSYWNSSERLSLDPQTRLRQLLTELYDQDEEPIWLNNAIYLLLQAAEKSADFQRPLFNFDLNCSFAPLLINQYSLNVNRQQPVTSSFALINQMVITASQAQVAQQQQSVQKGRGALAPIPEEGSEIQIQAEAQGDVVMQDSNELVIEQASQEAANLKVIGRKKKSPKAASSPAAQNPPPGTQGQQQASLFTLSQAMPSSLVATHFQPQGVSGAKIGSSPPGDASLSGAFFTQKSNKRRPAGGGFMLLKAS